jgi:hypothetical protein
LRSIIPLCYLRDPLPPSLIISITHSLPPSTLASFYPRPPTLSLLSPHLSSFLNVPPPNSFIHIHLSSSPLLAHSSVCYFAFFQSSQLFAPFCFARPFIQSISHSILPQWLLLNE